MSLVLAGLKFGAGMLLGVISTIFILAAICWAIYALYDLWIEVKYLKKYREEGKNAV